ncbi:MAG: polyhydroxyalkanoic acid system family protein [Gammaproteobacteria bacterium]|nr:polyhydroxyalkanoic acid system family protein [Gammaproteobacteria bacterium]MBU0787037.1 polyhydroxyalkanoic acid system family protein [Gammaproteobacteria bacterium]MBU0816288.1 polyhydroxyalkanoic acid system family protein [Gammaproteobacteria bacterium]MBU1787925.1 polyhydroxyalkanoic acid system family protein [Gammaproteobacteria bacterium]
MSYKEKAGMAQLEIQRRHELGWEGARRLAREWLVQAQDEYSLRCTLETGDAQECIHFERAGISGTLVLSAEAFELRAKLGFLLSAYQQRIESELHQRLDGWLGPR